MFETCFAPLVFRFRAEVKDLEMMMQNLISSAFETVNSVEEGVQLLDVFQHLSAREVFLLQTQIHLAFNSHVFSLSVNLLTPPDKRSFHTTLQIQ